MSKAIRASVLVLLLACSAQAGWIQNPVPDPPPPANAERSGWIQNDSPDAVNQQNADGDIQNDSAGSLTQIALDLLTTLPSLF